MIIDKFCPKRNPETISFRKIIVKPVFYYVDPLPVSRRRSPAIGYDRSFSGLSHDNRLQHKHYNCHVKLRCSMLVLELYIYSIINIHDLLN